MRCEVVPSEITNVLKFTSSAYSSHINENIESTYGLISKSGLWLYIVHDTIINIYCTESGKWQGGHCFGESLKNPSAKITAVAECISSHISFPCLILAIQQDHESLVCMFDVSSCKVVQAVLVPDRVTSLDVVSGNGGVCIETHNLCRRLRYMFGIVAVGTRHGHVFFLDLCLDEEFICDELLPNITAVVKKKDFSPQKREMAISKKQHIFLHLNDESTSGSSFEFKSRSSILGRYANGDVSVTAVKYIQSLTTLTVGFNFGGIQLWDLHTLMLQFTISDDQHEQSIVSFAFQEPENDPRNFCYLWAVKGHSVSEEDLPSSVSVSTLYSLTYFKREFRDGFGALYSELQTCNKRFEFPLTSGSGSVSSIGTRLLSCQVVSQKEPHILSANDGDSVSEDMSVCFLSWEVWPDAEHLPPSYHLAVFDLNQWYQAHMPFNFRCSPNELNSYFGIFSVDEISKKFNDDGIMGLYIVPQSIKKFKSLLVSEEFFYPSSLGFHLLCFSENAQCKATYFGFQRHLLFEIAELGPKVMLNPKEIYSALLRSGLVSDKHGGADKTPLTAKKEAILQLALEYHLPFFFMKCMKEWRYGDSIHEGCTSKALLGWAWKKVITIKNSIDRLSVPLFNCSGVDLDKGSLKYLYSFRRQLTLIDSIIEGYQKYVTPRTEQGIQELQCRKYVISSINMYLQVLLWLRSVQVLPEVCEEEATAKSVVYRSKHLEESFSLRRARLRKLHSSLEENDVFMIDGMVSESGISSSWLEKNGSGIYPPPSIYAAIACYLLDGVSFEVKHALVYYLLLDLQDMNTKGNFSAELKKFPVIFGMNKGWVKLIKAFWYLDRKDSENALRKLLHPSVRVSLILPWQHQRIIKSFLFWREPQKALKYIMHMEPPQTSMEDHKLYLSVLLACGAITQAYEYQRKKQLLGYGNELLNHLFIGCQEMQKLKDLMNLPLNSFESSALVKFLSESEDPRSQESLVIYHLLHCNLFQAAKVNEKLSRTLMNKLSSIYEATIYERTVDRDALVESLMSAISKPEKSLLEEMKRFPTEYIRSQEAPQPLSVSVKGRAVKAMTFSEILNALVQKSFVPPGSGTPTTPMNSSTSFYQDLPFLGPPVTPECIKQQMSFRSGGSAITKRSRLSNSPTEFSSPAKRTKLLDTIPFNASPLAKRKTPKSLAGDIVSLLQTPPIHRRTSSLKTSQPGSTPTITPQSILKKKVPLDFHLAATPPLCSEDENSEEGQIVDEKQAKSINMADVETPSRQIRFDLPDSPDQQQSPFPKQRVSMQQKDDSILSEFNESEDADNTLGPKSILNLKREPLRSGKKDISFHDEVQTREEISMEVEESVKVPIMVSAIYERSIPKFSFASDSGIAASATSSRVPTEPEPKSSNESSSEIPSASNYNRSPHRSSYFSPQAPLKSDLKNFNTPVEINILDTETKSSSEIPKEDLFEPSCSNLLQPPHTYSYNTPSNKPPADPLVLPAAGEESEEQSDNEMFYSPSAENIIPQQSFTFSQPINLFPESNQNETQCQPPQNENYIDFIEADYSFLENADDSSNTVPFVFSEPSDDSFVTRDEQIGSATLDIISQQVIDEFSDVSSNLEVLKPPRRTYVFSKTARAEIEKEKNVEKSDEMEAEKYIEKYMEKSSQIETEENVQKSAKVEYELEEENVGSEELKKEKSNEASFVFRVPSPPIEKMPRKSRTFVFGKNYTDVKNKSKDENVNLQMAKKEESSFVFKTPLAVTQTSRPSFSFSIPNPVDEDPIKDDVQLRDSSATPLQDHMPTGESKSVFKHKYTFTKTKSSKTKKVNNEQTPKSSIAPVEESASFVFPSDMKSRPSRRTYVFTRNTAAPESLMTQTNEDDLASSSTRESESQSKEKLEFMKTAAESYEEFSCSLKQKNSDEGVQQDYRENTQDNPSESTKLTTSSPQALTDTIKTKTSKKKSIAKVKVSKAVGTTPGLTQKKSKPRQRMEFSFAEPNSPATPEILEVLAKSPEENPLPSFLFSPPLTRGRLRKKNFDESNASSFCSETSFARPEAPLPPPIDPLLEGIIAEKSLQGKTKRSAAKRRGGGRKPKVQSQLDFSDASFVSNASLSESVRDSPSKRNSSARDTSMRHSMVLRQTKAKHKPDNLF